jgi:hypothetical protein
MAANDCSAGATRACTGARSAARAAAIGEMQARLRIGED